MSGGKIGADVEAMVAARKLVPEPPKKKDDGAPKIQRELPTQEPVKKTSYKGMSL